MAFFLRKLSIIAALLVPLQAQSLLDLQRQSKNANFGAFNLLIPPMGSALPSTCLVGQFFFLTNVAAGSNLYSCTTANTWTLESGGGGGGASAFGSITSGTNNSAAMIVGTGSSLTATGSGVITATGVPATGITGLVPITTGGTGTSTPSLIAGANVTISGSWPNQTIIATSTAATAFSAITSSTNNTAAMVVGSGASIAATGSGTVAATTMPGGGLTGAGSVPSSVLPLATTSIFGAVKPDGSTITISGGVISSTGGGGGLPSQSGHGNQYLTTNGTTASWGNILTGASGALDCSTIQGVCDISTALVPLKQSANTWTALNNFTGGIQINGVAISIGGNVTNPFSIVAYGGAVADGSTDNYSAIQNTINAACASVVAQSSFNYGTGAYVWVPGTTATVVSGYAYSKPIVLPCQNLTFEGQGQTSKLVPSYAYGEAMVVRPAVGAASGTYYPFPVGAPLVGSTGNSMWLGCNNGTVCGSSAFPLPILNNSWIDVGQVINPGPSTNGGLGGLSALTVEAVVKLADLTNDGFIVSSYGAKGSQAPGNAFTIFYQQAINRIRATMRIAGTDVAINASAAPTTGTIYALALSYDGSNVRFFINGVVQGTVAATGTVTQTTTEHMLLGPKLAQWPFGALTDSGMIGQIDNVRISNTARYTSGYTPATSKFTTDSNTMALYNFTNQFDAFTQVYGLNGSGWAQYQVVQDLTVNFQTNVSARNFSIQQNATGSGFSCQFSPTAKFENINIYFGLRTFSLVSNCYESKLSKLVLTGGGTFSSYVSNGEWDLQVGNASGVVAIDGVNYIGGQYQLVTAGGASFKATSNYFQTESGTINPMLFDLQGGKLDIITIDNSVISTESGGTSISELAYISNIGSVINFNGGYLESVSTATQLVTIDGIASSSNGLGQVNLNGTTLAASTSATQFLKFVGTISTPVQIAGSQFITTGSTPPAGAPISLTTADYIILGAGGGGSSATSPQIITSGLIGQYAMNDASGTTLPDSSGGGHNGTLVSSPTIGPLGITFTAASAQYATLPSALNAYKTVQVFADTGYTQASGVNYQTLVGGTCASGTCTSLLLNSDGANTHMAPSSYIFNGALFTTVAPFSQGTPSLITLVADTSADLIYVNGNPAPYYSAQGGSAGPIATSGIELGAGVGSAASFPYQGQIYYSLFYNRKLSAQEVQQNYQAVSAILAKRGLPDNFASLGGVSLPSTSTFVMNGDSITAGVLATTTLCANSNFVVPSNYTTKCLGFSGYTVQSDLGQAKYHDTIASPFAGNDTMVIFLGTNDLAVSTLTAQQTHDLLLADAKAHRLKGWKVMIATMISRNGVSSGQTALNNLLRSDWQTGADGLIDLGADPTMGCSTGSSATTNTCYSNSTYFNTDGVHPKDAGQSILATDISAGIASLPSGGLPRYIVANLPISGQGTYTGQPVTVTDATTPTYNGTLVGSGSVVVTAVWNGSAWVSR